MPTLIDYVAREQALRDWGLPDCLHVPIAAIDENAIEQYVGKIAEELSHYTTRKAFLVRTQNPSPIDKRYPIFELQESSVLHSKMQVWVHVAYSRYRFAYRKAFSSEDISGKILSHAMNRRMAAMLGFQFVRITLVSRGTNSSSGFSEQWGVNLYRKASERTAYEKKHSFIRNADLPSLMLMMDMKLGGGMMNAVNEGQQLVTRKRE